MQGRILYPRKLTFLLFIGLIPLACFGLQDDPSEIDRFFVMGERCSGTNYVSHLLEKNFSRLAPTSEYGHKHFLSWFDYPAPLGCREKETHLEKSDNCLFILVVRNPYDWLRSFYSTPHHVHPDLLHGSFYHFISHPWKYSELYLPHHEAYELIDGMNPETKRPFENICELRTYKLRNYLSLGQRVKNFCVVRYEEVLKDPKGLIQRLADIYYLTPLQEFIPITSYKGESEKAFIPKRYSSIKRDSLAFINHHLDWELENQFGYAPIKVREKSKVSRFFRKLERLCRKGFSLSEN